MTGTEKEEEMRPLVVGHRGAAAHALENTLSSFRKAVHIGVDIIEFDIHESLDGEFIVIHDSHLGRVSGRRDVVAKTHSRELQGTELYGGERLLLLSEAFEAIPRNIGLLVEIKALRSYARLVEVARIEARLRSLTLTSFDWMLLRSLQPSGGAFTLGVVAHSVRGVLRAMGGGLTFSYVCLDFQRLNAKVMSKLRSSGYRVFAWTVDRAEDIERMLELEVDGIISDSPDLVRKIYQKRAAFNGN